MRTQTESNAVLGALALVLLAAAPLQAGSPASPKTGDHLRATVRDDRDGAMRTRTMRGMLTSVDADSLVLSRRFDLDPYRIARTDVVELERLTRAGNRLRSVGYGVLATTAVAVTAAVIDGDDKAGWFAMTAEEKAVFGSVLLLPVGVLLGLAASHGDAWEPVATSDLQLGIAPAGGGGAFAVSVGF